MIIILAIGFIAVSTPDVFAFSKVTSSGGTSKLEGSETLGAELFDVFMNRILGGPIGWVAVAAMIVISLFSLVKGNIQGTIIAIVVGILIKGLPTIMNSLGATLSVYSDTGAMTMITGILIW
jgi:hypothetical protein